MQSPDQIQLVDSMLTSIEWNKGNLVLSLQAESHAELHIHTYATQIVISNASISGSLPELPGEITEVDLNFPKHSSYFHYLTLPFAMAHPCRLVFTLSSGSTLEVSGDSLTVIVGDLLSSYPIVFDL